MQTKDKFSLFSKSGTFIEESKNRFICEVDIDGQNIECYIPSSCRLDNFIDLTGKTVLLSKNKTKSSRTAYSVSAIPYKSSYILLNTALSNKLILDNISSKRFSFLGTRKKIYREQKIGAYKADLLIDNRIKTIIEIKSIITLSNEAVFPTIFSQRAIDQLKMITELLLSGYRACYFFVSLNPYVKNILINSQIKEYHTLLNNCVNQGMVIKGYSCKFKDNSLTISKGLPISF